MSEIPLSEKLPQQVDMTLPQILEDCFLFPTPTFWSIHCLSAVIPLSFFPYLSCMFLQN